MTKLNDMQSILLAAAAARDNGSLLPFPDSLAGAADRATRAIAALIKRGLAIETEVTDPTIVHRTDGDLRYGVLITDAGLAAIGVETEGGSNTDQATPPPAPSKPERQTKSALVVNLLQRDQGATLAELVEATGWLPHTTRAALTGVKKKGHVIEKTRRDDATCYRIVEAA